MFTILPFGNATVVGEMTGAQILEVLEPGPHGLQGVIQPAGLKYKYFATKTRSPGPQPYAWGAFDACVVNKITKACEPLDMNKTYKVGTNEFLAPAGGDGYHGFKYMNNITYWGDMLNAVNAYVAANYGTPATAYKGPNGDGTLDGRITRDGTDAGGNIVPITVLHHNDSHGNLVKGAYVGYTQLATLIKQERAAQPDPHPAALVGRQHPGRRDDVLLQDRARSAIAADGTPLSRRPVHNPPDDGRDERHGLRRHGRSATTSSTSARTIFTSVLRQATFPTPAGKPDGYRRVRLVSLQVGPGVQPYVDQRRRRGSRWLSWVSATTACPTTSCPATSPG